MTEKMTEKNEIKKGPKLPNKEPLKMVALQNTEPVKYLHRQIITNAIEKKEKHK